MKKTLAGTVLAAVLGIGLQPVWADTCALELRVTNYSQKTVIFGASLLPAATPLSSAVLPSGQSTVLFVTTECTDRSRGNVQGTVADEADPNWLYGCTSGSVSVSLKHTPRFMAAIHDVDGGGLMCDIGHHVN